MSEGQGVRGDASLPGRSAHRGLLLLGAVYTAVWTASAWVADDAYIVTRVVRNLVDHHEMTWNLGQRVQVSTSPAWTLWIAGVSALGAPPHVAALVSSFAWGGAALFLVAHTIASRSRAVAVAAVAVVLSMRTLVLFLSSGLETPMLLACLAWFLRDTLRGCGVRRVGWWAAVLTLIRPDSVMVWWPVVAWHAWRAWQAQGGWAAVRDVALGSSPWLAWGAWSTVYFGSPLPNTALAKLHTGRPIAGRLGEGWDYVVSSCWEDPLLGPVILAGLVTWRWGGVQRAWALGMASQVAFVVWVSDYMPGRFLIAPALVGVLLVAWTAAGCGREAAVAAGARMVLAAGVVWALVVPGAPTLLGQRTPWMPDVDHALPVMQGHHVAGFIGRWWWPRTPSTQVLEEVRGPRHVRWIRAAGAQPYLAEADVLFVDSFALGDPLLSRLPGVAGHAGHYWRKLPDGYLEVLAGTARSLSDPQLEAYRRHVARVTTGDLWAWDRWASMWHLAVVEPVYAPPYVGRNPVDVTWTRGPSDGG